MREILGRPVDRRVIAAAAETFIDELFEDTLASYWPNLRKHRRVLNRFLENLTGLGGPAFSYKGIRALGPGLTTLGKLMKNLDRYSPTEFYQSVGGGVKKRGGRGQPESRALDNLVDRLYHRYGRKIKRYHDRELGFTSEFHGFVAYLLERLRRRRPELFLHWVNRSLKPFSHPEDAFSPARVNRAINHSLNKVIREQDLTKRYLAADPSVRIIQV